MILFFLIPVSPAAAKAPAITASAGILMDAASGQVYYAKQGDARREPASLTKIMTAILAIEYGHMEEVVTVSRRAASVSVGQDIGLQPGDRLTLENIVKAALVYSANDSTVAIAEHIAGSEKEFVRMMNAKALLLGAYNTQFTNTNGYHNPNHYTTAKDLALITRYALGIGKFRELVSTCETTVSWEDGREKTIRNTNRLLRDGSYQGIYGVKTGSTPRAGDCLITAAVRSDKKLIAVVLHSRNRYQDAVRLLDYGFNHVVSTTLCRAGEEMARPDVTDGVLSRVPAVAVKPLEVILAEDQLAGIKKEIKIAGPLQAPVRRGQRLGQAIYMLEGSELARVNLVSSLDVPKPGVLSRIIMHLTF
jgi:D-alanyl-D-alanine carboxypeptidase (penicillin-binding protein 5/6)